MSSSTGSQPQEVPRAAVPADVNAPDKIAYGLSARQLATLAAAGTCGYGVYQLLAPLVAPVVLAAAAVPAAGLVAAVVLGRRDGLGLDRWLAAAAAYLRHPRHQTPTTTGGSGDSAGPDGGPGRGGQEGLVVTDGRPPVPTPLRLPAAGIDSQGVLQLVQGRPAGVVGCGTVNLALRTPDEQAGLLDGFGRWLNSLSAPAQIVISTQRVDLHTHAAAIDAHAAGLPHPALARAAGDHAGFLAELAHTRDPLRRQVLVVTHADPGQQAEAAARRAEATARALAALGVHAQPLPAPAVTAALCAAADPYHPPPAGGRAPPDTPVTGPGPQE